MERQELTEDVLFLACTRPAMWQGVPLEALALNGMATGIIFVLMSNPFYMLVGVAVHYLVRAFISHDYNAFTTLRLWAETKGRARNKDRWGGSSVSPTPLRPARRVQEVRIHV
jgi:type IV secretion system protein VirB3